VQRNGYGRQLHSGTFDIAGPGVPPATAGIFIRAPRITRCGPGVEVLARRGTDAVLVRQGPVLAACFHPELQKDHPVIAEFVARVRERAAARRARTPST
jgi:5'-phosphate synthase pdxT subunit